MKYRLRLLHQVPNTPDAAVAVTFEKEWLRSDKNALSVPKTTLADWDGASGLYTGRWPEPNSRVVRLTVDPNDPRRAWFADAFASEKPMPKHHIFFDGYLEKGVDLRISHEEQDHAYDYIFKVNESGPT